MANNKKGKNIEIRKYSDYVVRLRRARKIVGAVMGVSLAIFIVIASLAILNEGVGNFLHVIYSMNLYYYLAAFVILFSGYLLRFPKWERYLRSLKIRIGWWDNFIIYLSMYSMDITPGRWGRGVVSYTINRLTGTKFAVTFPAVVADIFTDFVGFGVVAIFFAFFVHKYFVLSVIITGILLLPFFFLYYKKPFDYLRRKLSRFRSLRSFWEVGELYFKENNKLGKSDYIYSLLFTIPSVMLNGIALFFVILAFGINVPIGEIPVVIFIYSSSLLFGIVTGAPATLGVTDAALVSYLTFFFPALGMTFGIAAAITIFFRIVSVWFVPGFGSGALFYSMRHWKIPKVRKT